MSNEYNGKKRSELPDSVFGIPQERKYPMPDEKHTRSAIKLFNHVDPKYEEQLAKAVIKNMKKYGIDGSVVGPNNRLRKYLPKDMIKESTIIPPIYSFEREPIQEYKPIPGPGILSVIRPISQKDKNDIQHIMNNLDGFEDFVFNNICFYDIERYNQTPIGFVILRKKPELHTAFVSIGVAEGYRGSGIGSKLLEKAISYFKSTKDLIWLEYWVDINNKASIALAEKSGFIKYLSDNTSRSLGYYKYHMKNDNNIYEQVQESAYKSDFSYSGIKTSSEKSEFKRNFREVFKEDPTESSINYMQMIKYKGSLVGYIGFSRYKEGKKKYLGIGNFMILKKYQRNGIGSKVISDIIDRYKDNYDEIYCYVDKDNKKAIKFYENIGHVNTGNLTKYGYYVSLYNGTISESSLLEMKRSELDDSEFGLPELRKYPMPDKDHVLSAIRFFNYVSPENEKELARNIKKKMKQYNISPDRVGDKNRLKKYLTEDMDIVMDLLESLQFTNFEHTKPVLVFDLGSVLVDNKISFKETLYKSKLIPDDIVEELDVYIGDTYWNNKDKLEYYSEDEFYKFMIDRAPEYLKSYIPAALKLQDSDLRLLDYSKTLIKKLKEKGYKLYYISNWSKWSKDKLTRSGFFDFLKDFDGGIFSGDVGHMKPDNAIFQYFFNKHKEITPTECIFFDDRHDNISAAMNIGMYGILFNKLYTVEWIYDNLINGNEE